MKKLLVLAVVSTCAFAGWRVLRGEGDGGDATAAHDRKLVLDRIWIDHIPTHERDQISVFAAITDEPVGIFQTTSVWKGNFEMLRYEFHDHELRLLFPQDGAREQVKTRAHKCDANGFEYCLELDGASRGVKRYYSRKGWEIDGASGLGELRARILAALQMK
jgi:hypothetical protein